jgi:hypothetical protein
VTLLVAIVVGAVVSREGYWSSRNRTLTSPQRYGQLAPAPAAPPPSTSQSSTTPRESPSTPTIAEQADVEQAIVQQLRSQWQSISQTVPFPFTLGGTTWTLDAIQFIGNSRLLVQFEDGHVAHAAVLEVADHRISLVQAFLEPDFPYPDWVQLVKRYGNSNYPISTYSWEGDSESFKRASEQVFVAPR